MFVYGEENKLRKHKIGYIRLTSEFSGEAFDSPEGNNLENGISILLKSKGVEVIKFNKAVNYFDNAIEASKLMLAEDVDAVVVFISSWIESTTGHTLVKELKGIPVIFWTYTTYETGDSIDTTGSLTGFCVLKGALERLGYYTLFIVGDSNKKENIRELENFLNVTRTIKEMDRARVGLIGYFGIGMYSATIDNLLLKHKIGPEIVSISELEFMDTIKNIKDNEISPLKKYLIENMTIDKKSNEDLLNKVASMYIALDKLIKKYKLNAINPKCHFDVSKDCMACIPLSLLADRKIVTGCESDLLLSISMLLHYYLSNEVITYFDIMDFNENSIYFSNCGFSPLSLVEGKPFLAYCDAKDWGFTGLTNGNLLKKGNVDMLRIFEKINCYGLLYAKAKSIDTVVRGNRFPSMKVTLRNPKEFINMTPSQHISIAYSDVEDELKMFCKYKNIEFSGV